MAIFFALSAALSWGIADFFARYATRGVGTYRTLFFMQFTGLVVLTIYLAWTGQFAHVMTAANLAPWLWAILVGLINIFSSLMLYRSFEVGILAIVSPIAASSSAITVALSLLSGEHISILHTFGISAAIVGVVLAATTLQSIKSAEKIIQIDKRHRLPPGVILAIIASLGYGIMFWLLGFFVTPRLGGVAPIWLFRLMTPCVLPLLARPLHQSLRIPRGNVWWFLLGVSIFDTFAFTMGALGLATGQVAIVSVLASLFSTVTVLLAGIFLRERLQWNQWFGIALIFAGIVLVNV